MQERFAEALRHHQAGRLGEAERLYGQILADDSGHADSWHLLGMIAHQSGRSDVAVALIGKAIELDGAAAAYHYNLAIVLKESGRLGDAIAAYNAALRLEPGAAEIHCNLGISLKEAGRLDDAVIAYDAALRIKPDFAKAHYNLGNALTEMGRLDDAAAAYGAAVRIKPDYAQAHCARGTTLRDLGRLDEAKAAYRAALCIKPDDAKAYYNLGIAWYELGGLDQAVAAYDAARSIEPARLSYEANFHLIIPIIPESREDIAFWRDRYGKGLAALAVGTFVDEPDRLNQHSFYLAYHERDDRPFMEALAALFRRHVPRLTATSPHIAGWRPPRDRIRVGFLSEHLVTHTIGRLNEGIIRHLDRQRFELILIHTPDAKQDEFSRRLDEAADKSITLPDGLAAQQRAIAAEELDVLFFPDIGMAQSTYFLAYARLAPVQAVTWGHPDTTGLDTMDYFLSPASFEPEGAETDYSETLIRLDRANCYYMPPETPAELPSRASLGLPQSGTLYGCQQALFKFHPDFDAVLAAIAAGDPTGHIVLLEGKYENWGVRLRARWAKTAPALVDRMLFLPMMPRRQFMAVQARMDVLLDPIYFGGGNTVYEAMVYGVPMVTWPGRYLRSRIAAGFYRQMGVAEAPVASRLEDYVPLALALGRDPDRRQRLRESLIEAAGRELFADMRAVREFEVFLDAAVAAAGQGVKLSAAWRSTSP